MNKLKEIFWFLVLARLPARQGSWFLVPALLVTSYLLLVTACYAQTISSTELINNAKDHNGTIVAYKGEIIGDIMLRGGYAWINVNDEKNAIGIWIKKGLIQNILYTGSYKAKGDLVEITGVFNRSCIEHGGDLDIHAKSIKIISSGNQVSHAIDATKIIFASALFIILALIYLLRSQFH